MHAGTVSILSRTIDEPLTTNFASGGRLPGVEVRKTQTTFDDQPVQSGVVGGHTNTMRRDVTVSVPNDHDRDPSITVDEYEGEEIIVSEFVADVTGSGLLISERTGGDGALDFPFDVFYNQTTIQPQRQAFDIARMKDAWADDDALGDVWMVGKDPGDGARMNYHAAADNDDTPTFGLGFERPWNNSVVRGVVYESGYVAVYNEHSAERFIRFVDDELMPYTLDADDVQRQSTLGAE